MLPDPKKVAKVISDALFKPAEEKQAEREQERDVQLRTGKARIRHHINRQQEMVSQLTALAKRALALNDEDHFRQAGRQMLWCKQDIQRWEKYLLSLDILQARRDQVKASVDLIQSVKAISASLAELAGPQNVADLQKEMEQGLARAASLEERMDVMMAMMDDTLSGEARVDEGALEKLKRALTDQVAEEETAAFDPELEAELRQIRQELEKPSK